MPKSVGKKKQQLSISRINNNTSTENENGKNMKHIDETQNAGVVDAFSECFVRERHEWSSEKSFTEILNQERCQLTEMNTMTRLAFGDSQSTSKMDTAQEKDGENCLQDKSFTSSQIRLI